MINNFLNKTIQTMINKIIIIIYITVFIFLFSGLVVLRFEVYSLLHSAHEFKWVLIILHNDAILFLYSLDSGNICLFTHWRGCGST